MSAVIKPGAYEMADAEYFADPCPTPSLSRSDAWTIITKSPLHCWWQHPRLGNAERKPPADNMIDGIVFEKLLIGNTAAVHVIDADNYRGGEARAQKAEAFAQCAVPILKHKLAALEQAAEAVHDRMKLSGLERMFKARQQLVLIAQYGPIALRGKLDSINPDTREIWDLKLGKANLQPVEYGKHAERMGYSFQAYFYTYLASQVFGGEMSDWVFRTVAVEADEPHSHAVFRYSEATFALNDQRFQRACQLFDAGLRSEHWPGYHEQEHELSPPTFAEYDEIARDEQFEKLKGAA
jgi:hypothetical protein